MLQKKYEIDLDGEKLSFEFGFMAKQADVSVLVRYGDTAVNTTIVVDKTPKEGIDFFPLSVEYEEKLYAVGKIPGGFKKREGRATDEAILVARAIDRPLRPLFPKDLRNNVVVNNLVLASDIDHSPEFAAMNGSNLAAFVSEIPFNGPIATVNIGIIDSKFVLNPKTDEREKSDLVLTLAGSYEKIVMIEAGGKEIPNDKMMEAIEFGHKYIKKLCNFFEKIRSEIGMEKFEYESQELDHEILEKVRKKYKAEIEKGLTNAFKADVDKLITKILDELKSEIKEEIENLENEKVLDLKKIREKNEILSKISEYVNKVEKEVVREKILTKGIRVDGRNLDEVRKLDAKVGLFNRLHGSGMFTRGETGALTITTLGRITEEQKLDNLSEKENKRYIHQYNFPPYSVGEARTSRGPGRREIGHGALAEKALVPVLPSEEEFPYTIRVVSEIMGSNGSTSLASVCGSTLSLMDAGVPIKKPVAGISVGLFTREDGTYEMPIDIQGLEDFFGDMDFKVAGTKDGITAIQVDIKIDGLTIEQVRKALDRTEKVRIKIIDEVILKAIKKPRKEISEFAPKTEMIKIDAEKIGKLIGPSGKNINKIIEETGAEIDIEDDGKVVIYSKEKESIIKAKEMIELSVIEYKKGDITEGVVSSIVKFGAFLTLPNGEEALLHISKISKKRVNNVEDVLKLGQKLKVKIDENDDGKISVDARI